MAKSKSKKAIDEEEEDIVEEADADEEEPADVETDDEPDEPSRDEPAPKKAKITRTALALIFLNWMMALVFLVLAWTDHTARTRYAHHAMVNYAQIYGLPLKQEEDYSSASNHTRPILKLSHEQLKSAFTKRPGVEAGAVGADKFQPVEEEVPLRLRPSDMTEDVLRDLFLDNPVDTLDAEIERVKGMLPNHIKTVAGQVADTFYKKTDVEKRQFVKANLAIPGDAAEVKKKEAEIDQLAGAELDTLLKRAMVHRTLFPIAWNVWQVQALDRKLNGLTGADLDNFVVDSLQRRMYYDILAPINVFRPGDLSAAGKTLRIERIADVENIKIDEIKAHLENRIMASVDAQYRSELHLGDVWKNNATQGLERDSIEKRKHVAFILFTISQAQKPLVGSKLVDKAIERAQVVSGLYEFTNASLDYVYAIRVLEGRVAKMIREDREGIPVMHKGKLVRTPGQIDEIELVIDRIVNIVSQIDVADKRLADLKGHRDDLDKTYKVRVQQHKDALERLLKARARTKQYNQDLQGYQQQLHDALIDLADAGERNFQIEAQIRAIEMEYLRQQQKKGVKK